MTNVNSRSTADEAWDAVQQERNKSGEAGNRSQPTDLVENLAAEADGRSGKSAHVLITKGTCLCRDEWTDTPCPVCEGGLAVCARCGEFEAGLDGPCLVIEAERMLGYAKTVSCAVAVVTDAQGSWFGVDKNGVRCTDLFERCDTCDQVGVHEDECPEGFHPITQDTSDTGDNNSTNNSQASLPEADLKLLREIYEHFDGIQDGAEDASYSDRMANKFVEPLGRLIARKEGK